MKALLMLDWRPIVALMVGSSLIVGAIAAEPPGLKHANAGATFATGLVRYQTPAGEDYSAVLLPAPKAPVQAATSHDHLLIVDTSASQSGVYRTRTLSIASAYLAAVPAGDRVMLVAADVSADDLTSGFVNQGSPELKAGLERLNERVPLGSSNLEVALRTALNGFKGDNSRSILFLGDGFSTAQLIQSPEMKQLVIDLRDAMVPVNSLGIGPRVDTLLLGTLAQHTGGSLMLDEPNLVADRGPNGTDAAKIGRELVRAAKLPIFYPNQVSTKPELTQIQPALLPPVRFDRETVLLGQGLRGDELHVELKGTLNRRPTSYAWDVGTEALNGSTGYLLQSWKLAEDSQGVAMPLAGRTLFLKGHDEYQSRLNDLVDAGRIQLQRKNFQQAVLIAETLQQIDPSNPQAREILVTSAKQKVQLVNQQRVRTVAQADAVEANVQEEEKPAVEDVPAPEPAAVTVEPEVGVEGPGLDANDRSNPKAESLLEELTTRQQVRIQELTSEVNQTVADATTVAKTDFEEASAILKSLIDVVDSSAELPESVRIPLRRKLDSALQKIQNDNEILMQKSAALRVKQSTFEARKKLMDQAERDEERMQQLIERVRALLTRGVRGEETAFEEAEEYARIAVELDPYNYVPNLDVFNAEAFGALDKARRMRALRADKFLAALYEVERAHVPFPDEPPVLWPSAERWREITIKREKWKSVDLKTYSKQEEKIVSALNRPMKEKFDFVDATLEDVRNKLVEVYEINVVIDKVKLEEESIATDAADINLVIGDIMLRNALKLLLDPKELTYSIQDEVLKITTKSDGAGKKPIKAVYAGDLATPVNPLFGSGGSGAGGQQGGGGQLNGGQQGGGFGGGAGGFGGGGGGGFGGGGGGNFFNVPPPKLKPIQGMNGNALDAQPDVKPKPVLPKPVKPAGDEQAARSRSTQQAFAQVLDEAASNGALNGDTLKQRKKKAMTVR